MLKDWNFWLSVITAIVAVVALIQTQVQIKVSNKQHLFDKRIKNYLIAEGLVQLYEKNQLSLKHEKDEPILAIDFEFFLLTNNTFLEQITRVISNTLEPSIQKEFLIKLENIKDIAAKIKFLFSKESAVLLGDFVMRYQELLFSMYKYKILIDKMQEASQNYHWTLVETQENLNESEQRGELLKAFDNLEYAYTQLKENCVEEILEKQIKL